MRRERLGRARVGQAVGMEPIDQPIEHQAGHRVRILVVHAHPRQRLLPLAIEFLLVKRRTPDDVGQQVEAKREAVFHHEHVGDRQVAAGTGAEGAANRVDGIGDLCGASRAGALIEQRGGQRGHALLARRVLRSASPDEQAQGDHGLLVVLHDDDLQPVLERRDLVRGKGDLARLQRPRWHLAGPVRYLRGGDGRQESEQRAQRDVEARRPH